VAANAPDLLDEGFDRALDAAEAMGALVGKPVVITAAVEERAEEAAAERAGPAQGDLAGGAPGQPAEGPQRA